MNTTDAFFQGTVAAQLSLLDETYAMHPTMLDGAESLWDGESVLHGLVLRFGVQVVIGNLWPCTFSTS